VTSDKVPVERDCPHCKRKVRAWFLLDGELRDPLLEVECPFSDCRKCVPFDPPGKFLHIEVA
jgi:hypothetical protein